MNGKQFSSAAWGICWGSLFAGNAVGAVIWGLIYDSFGTYNVGLYFEPVLVTPPTFRTASQLNRSHWR